MTAELPAEATRATVRIEALSDLVFGLALSLGAIALIQHIPQDLTALETDIATFGFSFLIIVAIWLGYSRVVSVLSVDASGTLYLNLALLFCVALEPFLYYVLQTADDAFLGSASSAFALDTGSMMALLAGMSYLVVRGEKSGRSQKLSPTLLRNFKRGAITQTIGAAIFIVSASSIFWVQAPGFGFVRFYVWYITLILFFATRAARRIGSKNTVESPMT